MRDLQRAAEVGFAQVSKERRAKNRETSTAILVAYGVGFESANEGAHLMLTLPDRVIDFWPGTGTFTDRKLKTYGRGVQNLVKKVYAVTGRPEPEPLPARPDPKTSVAG